MTGDVEEEMCSETVFNVNVNCTCSQYSVGLFVNQSCFLCVVHIVSSSGWWV